jgi:succinate dehydrogenase / fumarate reductase iron-sulfur subunit
VPRACVTACPNASASLFLGAQLSKYKHLPQGGPERASRANDIVAERDAQGFDSCSYHRECEVVCPKVIPVRMIAELNREFIRAKAKGKRA